MNEHQESPPEPLGDRRLRVGMIGCGKVATSHVTTVASRCGEVEIHLSDLDKELAERWAQKLGASSHVHDTPDSMFGKLDVIHILTPPGSHFPLAEEALRGGSHVILEKPAALGLEDTERLFQIAGETGKRLCVDHSMLYMPCVTKALGALRSGEFGRPVAFHSFFGHAESGNTIPYRDSTHWGYDLPGGVLQNLISHPASLLVEILGAPEEIQVQRRSRNLMPKDLPDSVQVSVGSASGYGTFMISMSHGNHLRLATVWCERGTLFMDLTRQITVWSRHHGPMGLVDKTLGSVSLGWQQIWQTMLVVLRVATKTLQREPGVKILVEQFYRALRSGGPSPVTVENALGVARIQQAALLDPIPSRGSCDGPGREWTS